jgi:hypothetical protein
MSEYRRASLAENPVCYTLAFYLRTRSHPVDRGKDTLILGGYLGQAHQFVGFAQPFLAVLSLF